MTAAAQLTVLGDEVAVPAKSTRRPAVTNDLGLIESVLCRAAHPGYVLGPGGRLAVKIPGKDSKGIRLAPESEALAVRQLIRSGHLTIGGSHAFELGRAQVSARSVLLTPATRSLVRRWRSYKPLHG